MVLRNNAPCLINHNSCSKAPNMHGKGSFSSVIMCAQNVGGGGGGEVSTPGGIMSTEGG